MRACVLAQKSEEAPAMQHASSASLLATPVVTFPNVASFWWGACTVRVELETAWCTPSITFYGCVYVYSLSI